MHHYRYALNKTRHEFVDRDQGPINAILDNDGKHSWLRLDPLVSLLTPRTDPDAWDGHWYCNEIMMQDEAPDPASDLKNVTVSACGPWAHKHLLFASDEEVSRLASSAAFKRELRARDIEKEPQGSIELKGAVEVLIGQSSRQGAWNADEPQERPRLSRSYSSSATSFRSGMVTSTSSSSSLNLTGKNAMRSRLWTPQSVSGSLSIFP